MAQGSPTQSWTAANYGADQIGTGMEPASRSREGNNAGRAFAD